MVEAIAMTAQHNETEEKALGLGACDYLGNRVQTVLSSPGSGPYSSV